VEEGAIGISKLRPDISIPSTIDTSTTLFHKHVQSVGGTAQLVRSFSPFGQSAKVWAGPLVVDDRIETFAWDATTGAFV
jgi:hypothetical protein